MRSRRLSRLRKKPSLQLRLLADRNKLHTIKKAGQRAAGVVREGIRCEKWKLNSRSFAMTSSLSRTRTSSHRPEGYRRPSAKDAQDIIQFEQVDFEQVAETRQAALQAKNDTNLAKHSGVSKNTQHNVS